MYRRGENGWDDLGRLGERRALILGFTTQGFGMLAMGLAPVAVLFWPGALVAVLGFGSVVGATAAADAAAAASAEVTREDLALRRLEAVVRCGVSG